jgi:transposase
MAQAEVDDNGSATELTSKEKKELFELRRDKRRLEMEVEILKRAAAYFARENVTPKNAAGSPKRTATAASSPNSTP